MSSVCSTDQVSAVLSLLGQVEVGAGDASHCLPTAPLGRPWPQHFQMGGWCILCALNAHPHFLPASQCTLSAAGILGPCINHTNKQESDPTTSNFRLLSLVIACYKFPESGVFQLFSALHMATRRFFKEEGRCIGHVILVIKAQVVPASPDSLAKCPGPFTFPVPPALSSPAISLDPCASPSSTWKMPP